MPVPNAPARMKATSQPTGRPSLHRTAEGDCPTCSRISKERSHAMPLLERVSTLVRANLNDLIDKAEHPEKMIKQVILDMQNQLLQVKTQVAIAIADQHLLAKKQKENEERIVEWNRKAEMAVAKNQDDLARAAIERSLQYQQ